jgi:long-chain acyl-CoA synthetase
VKKQGSLDADGLLYIKGRRDNMLNINGVKVNPEVIEKVLESHPLVQEAVVFPLSAAKGKPERLVAAVRHTGTPPEDLHGYCAEKLRGHLPRKFFLMKEFPRNPNGKVLRDQLPSVIRKALKVQAGTAAAAQKEEPQA